MSTVTSSKDRPRSESLHSRMHQGWRAVGNWWRAQSTALVSGEARRGGVRGMLAVLALFVAVRLVFLPSGFGFPFDAVFVTAAAAVIVALTALVVAVILATLRKSFSLGSCLPALRHVCPPRAARRRRSACKARGFERRARSSKRYIRDASERSLTFRALVAAFDDTDGLVYLREIETCAAITAGDVMREEIRRSIAKALAR